MKKRFGGQIWRRIAAAVTGLALLTALTACGGKTEKQAKGQEKAEDVNIVLDWYPNAVHAFLYEAIAKKVMSTAASTVLQLPEPSPSTQSGASAVVGMVCEATRSG